MRVSWFLTVSLKACFSKVIWQVLAKFSSQNSSYIVWKFLDSVTGKLPPPPTLIVYKFTPPSRVSDFTVSACLSRCQWHTTESELFEISIRIYLRNWNDIRKILCPPIKMSKWGIRMKKQGLKTLDTVPLNTQEISFWKNYFLEQHTVCTLYSK